jgi:mono/diheme cytochrome c family protein
MTQISLRSALLLVSLAAFLLVVYREEGAAQTGKTISVKEKEQQKAEVINRGKTIFVKATCWGCHPHGENSLHGDKPLKGPGFEKKYKSDRSIIEFVRKGSPNAGMPPFPREKLSDEDLKAVIVFIRSLSGH